MIFKIINKEKSFYNIKFIIKFFSLLSKYKNLEKYLSFPLESLINFSEAYKYFKLMMMKVKKFI